MGRGAWWAAVHGVAATELGRTHIFPSSHLPSGHRGQDEPPQSTLGETTLEPWGRLFLEHPENSDSHNPGTSCPLKIQRK